MRGFASAGLGRFRTTEGFVQINDDVLHVLTGVGFEPALAQRIYDTLNASLLGGLLQRRRSARSVHSWQLRRRGVASAVVGHFSSPHLSCARLRPTSDSSSSCTRFWPVPDARRHTVPQPEDVVELRDALVAPLGQGRE